MSHRFVRRRAEKRASLSRSAGPRGGRRWVMSTRVNTTLERSIGDDRCERFEEINTCTVRRQRQTSRRDRQIVAVSTARARASPRRAVRGVEHGGKSARPRPPAEVAEKRRQRGAICRDPLDIVRSSHVVARERGRAPRWPIFDVDSKEDGAVAALLARARAPRRGVKAILGLGELAAARRRPQPSAMPSESSRARRAASPRRRAPRRGAPRRKADRQFRRDLAQDR